MVQFNNKRTEEVNNMLYKQRGVSFIGIFLAILVAVFAMKMAVAIWPAYWDDRIIDKEITNALVNAPKGTTPAKFKQDLARQLEMNNIRDLNINDIMKVTNTSGLAVNKEYEVRKPFIANIELVMTFKKDFR